MMYNVDTTKKGGSDVPYEYDRTRARQLHRREVEKQRREQQKLMRRKLLLGIVAAVVIVGLCLLVTALVRHTAEDDPPEVQSTPAPTQPTEPETVITVAFGGDLNVTDRVVASGASEQGYDYTDVFMDVAPLLAGADTAVLNFEGNLCGGTYGTSGTRAPIELAQALSAAGVDLVQMANSCSLNNGLIGLNDTLSNLRSAGLEPVGAFSSEEEFQQQKGFTLRSIQGVKVAFVAFTKGMNDLGLPAGSENQVNLLYKDYTSTYQNVDTEGIKEILDSVALEQPDVTVALLHWGSEYNSQISDSQKRIVELLQDNGVDAIVGTHSHYVQQVEYDPEEGTVVAYSLGDFLGDADRTGTNYSLVLELEITKNNLTGDAKISNVSCTPIYTVTQENDGQATMRLLRIEPAIAAYEANSIGKVSQQTYTNMKAALSKILSRTEAE